MQMKSSEQFETYFILFLRKDFTRTKSTKTQPSKSTKRKQANK